MVVPDPTASWTITAERTSRWPSPDAVHHDTIGPENYLAMGLLHCSYLDHTSA